MTRFDPSRAAADLRTAASMLRTASALVTKVQRRLHQETQMEWAHWDSEKRSLSARQRHAASAHAARLSDSYECLQGVSFDLRVASGHVRGAVEALPKRRKR